MVVSTNLVPMNYGPWSERIGDSDMSDEYWFVDLFDEDTGDVFTWTLDEGLAGKDAKRPPLRQPTPVLVEVTKQSKPGRTASKSGDVIEFVREQVKCRVLAFSSEKALKAAA